MCQWPIAKWVSSLFKLLLHFNSRSKMLFSPVNRSIATKSNHSGRHFYLELPDLFITLLQKIFYKLVYVFMVLQEELFPFLPFHWHHSCFERLKNDHDRMGNGDTFMNERLLHAQLSWHLNEWGIYCSLSGSLFVLSHQVLVTHCHAIARSWQKHRHVWDLPCFIMC